MKRAPSARRGQHLRCAESSCCRVLARSVVFAAALYLPRCEADPLRLGPLEVKSPQGIVPDASVQPVDAAAPEPDGQTPPIDAGGDAAAGTTSDGGSLPSCILSADAAAPVALPMVVDAYFVPSGGAGDAASGALMTQPDCLLPRAVGAQGSCYTFRYTPLPPAMVGEASWAGLFFQYPVSNWGSQPGLAVAEGAQRVTFLAAGANGGEIVTFRAGGIRDSTGALGCFDEFTREISVRLTPNFERYEIDLHDVSYSRVLSAFSWKVSRVLFSGEAATPIVFYLDDLRWE